MIIKLSQLIYVLTHYEHWQVTPGVVYILCNICKIIKAQQRANNPISRYDLYRLKVIDERLEGMGYSKIFTQVYRNTIL
jgi:hypothetical protein